MKALKVSARKIWGIILAIPLAWLFINAYWMVFFFIAFSLGIFKNGFENISQTAISLLKIPFLPFYWSDYAHLLGWDEYAHIFQYPGIIFPVLIGVAALCYWFWNRNLKAAFYLIVTGPFANPYWGEFAQSIFDMRIGGHFRVTPIFDMPFKFGFRILIYILAWLFCLWLCKIFANWLEREIIPDIKTWWRKKLKKPELP